MRPVVMVCGCMGAGHHPDPFHTAVAPTLPCTEKIEDLRRAVGAGLGSAATSAAADELELRELLGQGGFGTTVSCVQVVAPGCKSIMHTVGCPQRPWRNQDIAHHVSLPGAFGKVYRGLWRGTQVAIKTILLPARMSGAEKRERMVSPALPPAPGMVLLRLCSGCLQLIGANTTVCMHCSPACQL